MTSREQTFFLSVLADHLNGRPTEPVAGLDWESIYSVAVSHQVAALVYAQCGAFLPPEAELQFLQDYGAAVADYAARRKIAAGVDREFTRQGIPYVIVKGVAIAESYPNPELRTMGDIDVIVRAEDKQRAHTALLKLGLENQSQGSNEWIYWQGKYELELHHRLLYDELTNASAAKSFAERMWDFVLPVPGSSRHELSPEFHFLFLVMHLKKHLMNFGAGFRQFMDLAVAAQKWQLDWARLDAWLAETELRAFAGVCLSFCRTWFQLPLPLAGTEIPPEFEQEMRQRIFSNGVFGFDNRENRNNLLIASLNARGGDGLRLRLRMCREELLRISARVQGKIWLVAFPSYEFLRQTAVYGFIDRRPWLLPVAWIYRFIRGSRCKLSQVCRILFFRHSAIRKRGETLKKLGLPGQSDK